MTEKPVLTVSLDALSDLPTIRVVGELDLDTSPAVRRAVASIATEQPDSLLIFDLRQVTFIDASGLKVLVDAQKHLGRGRREVVVITDQPSVLMVLSLSGADGNLVVYPDEKAFLTRLQESHRESTGAPPHDGPSPAAS